MSEQDTPLEKKPFPITLALACVVVGGCCSAAYLYAGDRIQIYRNAEDIVELKSDTSKCRSDAQVTKIELVEMKSDLRHIKEGVDELRLNLNRESQ